MSTKTATKTIHIDYFAILREQRGQGREALQTDADTAQDLYLALQQQYHFTLPLEFLKVAVNNRFCDWDTRLNDNDTVVFIPPVAGG